MVSRGLPEKIFRWAWVARSARSAYGLSMPGQEFTCDRCGREYRVELGDPAAAQVDPADELGNVLAEIFDETSGPLTEQELP